MRTLLALSFVLAACSGPTKKPEGAVVPQGSGETVDCCCKYTKAESEDLKPTLEMTDRMECSTRQGECRDETMCKQTGGGGEEGGGSPAPATPEG